MSNINLENPWWILWTALIVRIATSNVSFDRMTCLATSWSISNLVASVDRFWRSASQPGYLDSKRLLSTYLLHLLSYQVSHLPEGKVVQFGDGPDEELVPAVRIVLANGAIMESILDYFLDRTWDIDAEDEGYIVKRAPGDVKAWLQPATADTRLAAVGVMLCYFDLEAPPGVFDVQ